jgi:hypothetical protein
MALAKTGRANAEGPFVYSAGGLQLALRVQNSAEVGQVLRGMGMIGAQVGLVDAVPRNGT